MPIPTTETHTPGHRRSSGTKTQDPSHWRSRGSSSVRSPDGGAASHLTAMPIPTTETEDPGHRRSKRSSSGSLSEGASSDPTWVILNRIGARKDSFRGDRTTSAISHTSAGEQISVSFKFVEPPGTSLLTLDWPQGPDPMESTLSCPYVIAAHRGVVLFGMTSRAKCPSAPIDFFVYRASSNPSQRASLSRLPICYFKGYDDSWSEEYSPQKLLGRAATGLLSCSMELFIVAELERSYSPSSTFDIHMMWSGSDEWKWKVFKRLPVSGANDGRDLVRWLTDVVLPYRSQLLIWVDYYRGMIIGNMVQSPHKPPDLRFVPLPGDPVQGNPDDREYGQGCPEASCSVCVAGDIIKFVTVNQQGSGFSITVWSLRENYTWREDATLDAEELWALDSENRFPHVQPEFPVVNMENPDAICFLVHKGHHTADPSATTWMIEVHMKKQLLLAVTSYSKEVRLSDQNIFMTARMMSRGLSFISCKLPSYLPAQTMKKNTAAKLTRKPRRREEKDEREESTVRL